MKDTVQHAPVPTGTLWIAWITGPVVLTLFVLVAFFDFDRVDPKAGAVGPLVVLVAGHLVSGLIVNWLTFFPGPHRRTAEFWSLVAYWVGIAIAFGSAMALAANVVVVSCAASLLLGLAFPAAAIVRLVMRWRGRVAGG